MSKKKKSKKNKKEPEKSKNTKNIIIAVLAVVAIAVIAVAFQLKSTPDKAADSVSTIDNSPMRRGETRQTLSPSLFGDPFIAEAYRIAKEAPHVLDSLICYCLCDRPPFNHKSLLSCYVDKHAAGWGICLNEARRAYELYKDGRDIKEIKKIIDREFG